MGVNCYKDEDFDEITPCDLSGDDLAMITAEYEPQQPEATAEVAKDWTECSANVDQMRINEVQLKTAPKKNI